MPEMNKRKNIRGAVDIFEPGRQLGPIHDREDYEHRQAALQPEEKRLSQESTRLADLCHYFSQRQIGLPADVLEQIGGLPKLKVADRIDQLKEINQSLMEYLNDVSPDRGFRQ